MARQQELINCLMEILEDCKSFELEFNHLATTAKVSDQHKDYLKKLQKLVPIIKKTTNATAATMKAQEDARDDNFQKALDSYNQACSDGTLTKEMAENLIKQMKADLKKSIKAYNESTAFAEEKKKSAPIIRSKKAQLDNLNTDCIQGDEKIDVVINIPFDDLMSVSDLDRVYEEVIEAGIKMSTGPSKAIANEYKSALDRFHALYDEASEGEQKKWHKAKEEVEKNGKILQKKMNKAQAQEDEWAQCIPIGGYYRYAEGEIDDRKFQRLDWISRDVTIKKASKTNKDGNENIYVAGDNRIIIDLYKAEPNGTGDVKYTYTGEAYSPQGSMLQMWAMVSNPYTTEGEGPIPKMEDGEPKKNLDWSEILYSPKPDNADVVEIPDWTDGRVNELIEEYKEKCASGMPPDVAQRLKKEMLEEIKTHQEELIEQLDKIHHNQGERKDTEILLSIWKKKMETWKKEVNSLGEGCLPSYSEPEPCGRFEDIYLVHETLCGNLALPQRVGDSLKATMDECLSDSRQVRTANKNRITVLKNALKMGPSDSVEKEIKDLKKSNQALQTLIDDQQERRDALSDECIAVINTNVLFGNADNIITNSPDLSNEINAMLLNANLNLQITATTSAPTSWPVTQQCSRLIMLDPNVRVGFALTPLNGTCAELMQVRALAVQQIFVNAGIAVNRFTIIPGGNLGPPATNQRVTLQFN